MKIYPKLRLRGEFELMDVDGEVTAVCVGEDAGAYHGVIQLKNESAQFMFRQLQTGLSLPELIKACMDAYDSPVEEVGPCVAAFLDQLRDEGLLEADPREGFRFEETEKEV